MDYFKMLSGIGCNSERFNTEYFNQMNNWFRPYDDGLFNDNRLIIRINAFIRVFSFGSYHVHSIFFNFLSFIGLFELGKFLMKFNFSNSKIFIALFLVPSFVFWTSGILKETILVSIVGLFLNQLYNATNGKFKPLALIAVFLCFFLLAILKIYVLVSLFPLVFYLLTKRLQWRFTQNMLFPTSLSLVLFMSVSLFSDHLNPIEIIVNKQHNFIELAEFLDARSKIDIQYLNGHWDNMLAASPSAFFNTLLRPFPWDLNSIMIVLPFLENVFFLILVSIAIYHLKLPHQRTLNKKVLFQMLMVIVFLFVIIGLTTPVIGAIVRYKVPALPFLYLIVLDQIKFSQFRFLDKPSQWLSTNI